MQFWGPFEIVEKTRNATRFHTPFTSSPQCLRRLQDLAPLQFVQTVQRERAQGGGCLLDGSSSAWIKFIYIAFVNSVQFKV